MARTNATKKTAATRRDATPPADPRDAKIAELQAALAEVTAAPAQPVDHVSDQALAGAAPGQLVHYVTAPTNGSDPVTGYGLVLDVVTVDTETGGEPVQGQSTRTEVLVAPLDAAHRLPAAQVLDLIGT